MQAMKILLPDDPIRDDEKRKAQEKLEAMLIEGIESGEPTEMTREDWAGIRRDALRQFEARAAQPFETQLRSRSQK